MVKLIQPTCKALILIRHCIKNVHYMQSYVYDHLPTSQFFFNFVKNAFIWYVVILYDAIYEKEPIFAYIKREKKVVKNHFHNKKNRISFIFNLYILF